MLTAARSSITMKLRMSAFEANNPFDLLGQSAPPAPAVKLHGAAEPQLSLAWGQFHQGVASNFVELFRRARLPKNFLASSFFKDAWIERRLPVRAIFAAFLWHIVLLAMPFPQISGPRRNPAFANAQLTWSGPVEDFPLLEIPAARPKSAPRQSQNQTPAPAGADAFHPRQTIFTDPVRPTHARQTLINPKAPPIAPKILPALPNMVQLEQSAAPARPRIEISQEALKLLHPRKRRIVADPSAAAPEVQMNQQSSADLMLAATSEGPARPKLEINASAAPRVLQRRQDNVSDPAPEVAAQLSSPNGSGQALIALSAAPGPSAPVAPPAGNVSARVSISPEGKKPGVPGGTPDSKPNPATSSVPEHASSTTAGTASGVAAGGAGSSSTAVSITGGAPKNTNSTSGLGGPARIAMPSTRPLYTRAEGSRATVEPEVQTSAPNFALLAPGAKPEVIFARRRMYSMNVNMPNLNSATGSWILNFSAMRTALAQPGQDTSTEIAEPLPLKKVDPKYPPTLMAEHVEGEVILYAVIRGDGSVDGIQVVRGIDPLLDGNAVRALAQWKFKPAERNGEPVDLEAIVHIPFHAPER
jgi:TonB family protein